MEGDEMSLSKSKGNMYPWVTHMHTHLAGECPHRCSYCYVQTGPARLSGKYKGPIRLVESELSVNYGSGKTIFMEHMNDLFAEGVDGRTIAAILEHARTYPSNTYVFQTKNPGRAFYEFSGQFPPSFMMGTTAETNRPIRNISRAEDPEDRLLNIGEFSRSGIKTFVTIEPIMDFDMGHPWEFDGLLIKAGPSFVNIGADSKGCGLAEPSWNKIVELTKRLSGAGIEIREKHNLERLSRRLP
jgi:DNA repair photolyase